MARVFWTEETFTWPPSSSSEGHVRDALGWEIHGCRGSWGQWGSGLPCPPSERLGQKVTWGPDLCDFEVRTETGLLFLHHFGLRSLILAHGYVIRIWIPSGHTLASVFNVAVSLRVWECTLAFQHNSLLWTMGRPCVWWRRGAQGVWVYHLWGAGCVSVGPSALLPSLEHPAPPWARPWAPAALAPG